jgi:hypothetical protein
MQCHLECNVGSVGWMYMEDGDIGEGPMQSVVWLVLVLLGSQQRKLGHHGRVVAFFWKLVVRGARERVWAIFTRWCMKTKREL